MTTDDRALSVVRQEGECVLIAILVQPKASRLKLGPVVGDRLKVAVTAPPVDGKANEAVVKFLAKILGVPKSRVEVASGASSRRKTVRVRAMRCHEVAARIPEAS